MNILAYEFITADYYTYEGMLSLLVSELRKYRQEPFEDELRIEILRLQNDEKAIQQCDIRKGNSPRKYIEEILSAIDAQNDVMLDFAEEVTIDCTAVLRSLYNTTFSLVQCSYELGFAEHLLVCRVHTIDFPPELQQVIVETIRAVCYRNEVICIDQRNV